MASSYELIANSRAPVSERSFDDVFQAAFAKHFESTFRYIDRLAGDPDLAADVAQEAFSRLDRRGALPENTASWLAVVARNLFHNARSKARRRRRLLAVEHARSVMADPSRSPVAELAGSGGSSCHRCSLLPVR